MSPDRPARSPFASVVPVLALLLPTLAPAAAPAFEGARALALDDTLASDAYQGRFSGLPSGRKTEEFVAEHFAQWGLTPAGRDGTFFYPFEMLVSDEKAAELTLKDTPFGNLRFLYGDDFTVCTNSGSADVTAEVVVVGHGLSSPDREWDDYADLDITGKIALIHRGTPDNGYDWGEAGSRDSTLAEAVRRGAVGVIFVASDHTVQGAAVHERYPKIPSLFGSPRVLEHVLMNSGWDMKRYTEAEKDQPTHVVTGKRMRIKTKVQPVKDGHARDVVAMLEGSDPVLKNEIIVLGGHMDHVGTNGEGIIYNGANDNGSGTSLIMELARSFAQGPERPKRTLVFMTFAGEEQGLLGSKAFAADPSVDLDHAVAMINFDMVGHGNGKVYLAGGELYPQIRKAFTTALDSARADSLKVRRAWTGEASDYGPFLKLGIATMNMGSDGDHRFYHTLQDDVAWVDGNVIGSVGRMAEAWIRTVADWSDPLNTEHRAGRTLLFGSDQVDFDGVLGPKAPSWVRASVKWTDARDFGSRAWLDTLATLRQTMDADSMKLLRTLKDVRDASKTGKRATLLGLRAAAGEEGVGVPPRRRTFLKDLDVAAVDWDGGAPEDSTVLKDIAKAGVFFLVPPDTGQLAKLPKDAKRCIRLFPGIGERVTDPKGQPLKSTLFVVAYDGEGDITTTQLVDVIKELGVSRVHLDLVPWIGTADETRMAIFLEELRATGGWTATEMAALLGRNLSRL